MKKLLELSLMHENMSPTCMQATLVQLYTPLRPTCSRVERYHYQLPSTIHSWTAAGRGTIQPVPVLVLDQPATAAAASPRDLDLQGRLSPMTDRADPPIPWRSASVQRQPSNRQTTQAVARTPGGTRRASGGIQKPPGVSLRRSRRAKPVNPDLAAAQAAAEHARVARARAEAPSTPRNSEEEEDSGEEEDSDEEEKEDDHNSLPSPTIDAPAPRKFQITILKRFARRNGVSYEQFSAIMLAHMQLPEQILENIVPIRPSFAVVNYIKDEINEGRIETPLKLVYGMCGCHSCQALGSSNSLGCAFYDLASDFV